MLEDLAHDVGIGFVGFVGTAEFKGEATGGGDQGDFGSFEDDALVDGGDADDLVVGDGDHGFLFEEDALVVEDDSAVGDADKAGAASFAVEDGIDGFAGDDVILDALELGGVIK